MLLPPFHPDMSRWISSGGPAYLSGYEARLNDEIENRLHLDHLTKPVSPKPNPHKKGTTDYIRWQDGYLAKEPTFPDYFGTVEGYDTFYFHRERLESLWDALQRQEAVPVSMTYDEDGGKCAAHFITPEKCCEDMLHRRFPSVIMEDGEVMSMGRQKHLEKDTL